ncbi:MAG: site-2 protease family protein [Candidatus Micrarchaeaceae archaeon]|jgi:Zn-dependent protease
MADFSPTIGKIDGIPIQLHWSFILLLVFILVLTNLYFFVLWVLLFACVLIHELVHSITSKRNSIKVKKIVLYPFGGGSIIDFEKVNPETEFRISIVGPLSSLLLAVAFGIINIFTPAGIVGTTIQELFILNVFLGVFNILPWLPLDGGRALRSYLQKKMSYWDATQIAVKVSNAVTVIFMIGIVMYALLYSGNTVFYREFLVLFSLLIAFFVYSGAQAEYQSAYIKENTKNLKASDAITRNYIFVSPDTKISELYNKIIKEKTYMIVFEKDKEFYFLSNVSLQKVLKKTSASSKVADLGTRIQSIPYNTNLYTAVERMRFDDQNIAAVVRQNKIIGILLMQHIESIITLHISQNKG